MLITTPLGAAELDDKQFYESLIRDMKFVRSSAILDFPYVTRRRSQHLERHIERMCARGVTCCIHLQPCDPESKDYTIESYWAGVQILADAGAHITIAPNKKKDRHEKFVFLDGVVVYFGTVNALSNTGKTSEFMQREVNRQKTRRLIARYNLDNCQECSKNSPWTVRRYTPEDELCMVGATIAAKRKELGLTQNDLHKILKISRNTVSEIENGRANVSFKTVAQISWYLGIRWRPIDWHKVPSIGSFLTTQLKEDPELVTNSLFVPDAHAIE